MSDRERNIRATVDTPYYLASISKTIIATALVELGEKHQVDLDRPVNDYLHTAKVSSPMWDVSRATVRRVANHTGGLAMYDRDCLMSDRDCDASAAAAIGRYGVIVWPPGGRSDYSGTRIKTNPTWMRTEGEHSRPGVIVKYREVSAITNPTFIPYYIYA